MKTACRNDSRHAGHRRPRPPQTVRRQGRGGLALNLVVPRGCFFGFLGPNGAGKSTTIRMLTGLIPPSSGSIELLGMRLPDQELEIKRRIGLVPDESLLFDRLTGVEFLEFVGRMYGLARPVAIERAQSLLDLFELREERKLIAEYSKGMRKRVAMAASLIHHPELFLMDEPFEGVDAVGARLMKDILLDQVRRGATIFLTSHVLEVVERLCDRVAIIDKGKIVREGSMDELRGGTESLEDVFVRWSAPAANSMSWSGSSDPGHPPRAMAQHAPLPPGVQPAQWRVYRRCRRALVRLLDRSGRGCRGARRRAGAALPHRELPAGRPPGGIRLLAIGAAGVRESGRLARFTQAVGLPRAAALFVFRRDPAAHCHLRGVAPAADGSRHRPASAIRRSADGLRCRACLSPWFFSPRST